MNTMDIVVLPEVTELARKISRIPEERAIEILTPNRTDQSFDERVRNRGIRN
jgi:hypothetical protein